MALYIQEGDMGMLGELHLFGERFWLRYQPIKCDLFRGSFFSEFTKNVEDPNLSSKKCVFC